MPRRGEAHHFAKLCEEDVLAIRRRKADGETFLALAEAYGVTVGTIWPIVVKRTWRHLLPEAER